MQGKTGSHKVSNAFHGQRFLVEADSLMKVHDLIEESALSKQVRCTIIVFEMKHHNRSNV
jgi:hypothetical protein